ncbi:hypothetical protein LOB55_08950 [Lactobacillus delbrueckii subsp. lactis]|jgi:hypothetical protein|uniref:Uncharacterized protein n=5 Tax=Lactobacillus delbrueckii TaxID=1584 RepID=A0ABD4W3J4_9LACO|nr:hypothetical protein [Lactobacillus delbrueckii]ADQ61993.1 Hypothetical protein LDBND_1978 [Lactobacillus delbrueckii subsp. bulgaricus ND02]APG70287.1 hypothetical protein LL717_09805 [Lactobacillus delbrueckii subsp. lactis]ASW64726.1 hypothetical protein LDL34_10855 [Lactobacillus delbrueckii subsp. lactis]EFK31594.1 hypothetical protein HMPREF9264_1813 [Lactobacillus delbrueckii subsp. bulgaricus PB2003/044-T3-4]MBN6089231.1 hypothetical protein [Lactobacillus delbrueckii subsp. bulgari
MDSQLAKKIIIDVQISGWSCLIPASGLLYLYQVTHYASFLWGLALVVLYAAYVLATSKLDKWQSPSYVLRMSLIAMFFVGFLPSIPLLFCYSQERKAGLK